MRVISFSNDDHILSYPSCSLCNVILLFLPWRGGVCFPSPWIWRTCYYSGIDVIWNLRLVYKFTSWKLQLGSLLGHLLLEYSHHVMQEHRLHGDAIYIGDLADSPQPRSWTTAKITVWHLNEWTDDSSPIIKLPLKAFPTGCPDIMEQQQAAPSRSLWISQLYSLGKPGLCLSFRTLQDACYSCKVEVICYAFAVTKTTGYYWWDKFVPLLLYFQPYSLPIYEYFFPCRCNLYTQALVCSGVQLY